MSDWLSVGGVLGGIVAMAQLGYGYYKDRQSGAMRQGQAEAAKASLDAAQAELSLPRVQESLKLGNVAEAVAIQQQIINGLREHAAWQDIQLQERDARVAELEGKLSERDAKVAELEGRLKTAEDALREAQAILADLQNIARTQDGPAPR